VPTTPPLLDEPPVPGDVVPPEAEVPPLPSPCPAEPEEQPVADAAAAMRLARTALTIIFRFVAARSGRGARSEAKRRVRERPLADVADVM